MTPHLEKKFHELVQTVNAINAAVCGDPLSGRDGIHKRMDDIQATVLNDKRELEDRISALEKTTDKEKTKVAAISALICMVGSGVIKWLF
jgi:hypothetical protein